MPPIKWNAPKFWYEVGWRPFAAGPNPEPFMTQRVYPPQNQFAIPNPVINMRYQYYVKAVNQQPGGPSFRLVKRTAASLCISLSHFIRRNQRC